MKMTDNDIIEALECCCKNNNCEGCPFDYLTFSSQCASELAIKSLDLINRQKAKIKALQMDNKQLETDNFNANMNCEHIQYEFELLKTESTETINRQKAEIERLKSRDMQVEVSKKLEKQIKAEAVKEFWDKLKAHSRKMQSSDFSGEFWDKAILVEDGDNLLKETVGEQRKEDEGK